MTVLVAFMLASSLVAAAAPAIADEGDDSHAIHTLENDEGLYLVFGADLGDKSLEEYIEENSNPGDDVDVVEYDDVDNVEVAEEGEAASIAIDGGEAMAIQEATQQNANAQVGEATAEGHEVQSSTTEFENVGEVTLIFGNGDDQSYDGWGVGDGDGVSVSQTAEAYVAQAQEVAQANVNEQSTALAYAENESDAVAFQMSQQSNLNVQEAAANATNVFAADLDEDGEAPKDHQKQADGIVGDDAGYADVAQDQDVDQLNVNEQTSAVAIAVGNDSTATAIQMTDQSNLNEQVGTAEALNILMETAGMNVALAGTDAGTDLLTQDGEEKLEPKEKKGHDDDEKDTDVSQTAQASVTQSQSVEQANLNNQSSAAAVAVNGSEATAVQLSFQQNLNYQIATADALNIIEAEIDGDDAHEKYDKKGDKYADEQHFDSLIMSNTTSVVLDGDAVEGASHLSFDYDGSNDQLNDVEQWSNAEVQQSQEIAQLNLNEQQGAFAVAEDNGSADTVQLTIQENENVQFASAESTNVLEGTIDGEDREDHEKVDDDHEKVDDDHEKSDDDHEKSDDDDYTGSSDRVGPSDDETTDATDEETEDSVPGFGVLVAIVALGIVGAARFVSER